MEHLLHKAVLLDLRLIITFLGRQSYLYRTSWGKSFGQVRRLCLLLAFIWFYSAPVLAQGQEYLVGLTSNGGHEGRGTAFSVMPGGSGFSILKGFADWGKHPDGNLVKGDDGNFYGLTYNGGTYNYGTVFKVTPTGTVTVLHQFNNTTDGAYPQGSLLKASDGSFYGMTTSGGPNSYGTIFKISAAGTFTRIRSFDYALDGGKPMGQMIKGKDGHYYGITYGGGANGGGTIFKLTTSHTYTVLRHLTTATDGGNSYGSLVQASDGSFYGITYRGGANNNGTVFKITTGGTFTVIRHLKSLTDGGFSSGSLMQAANGNLYGMTASGGTNNSGTIFKVGLNGSFSVIRHLIFVQGAYPGGSLIQDTDGTLYGMASYGGANGYGSIFKCTTEGALTVMRSFDRVNDGGYPHGTLVRNSTDGAFYGMTSDGGRKLFGTIFKITTSGTFSVLNGFNGAAQGNAPSESLMLAKDGAFYGTTSTGGTNNIGIIFKLCGGTVTVLRSLSKYADGGTPLGSLIQGTDGNLYGTTSEGGTYGGGTIFKISTGGTYTVLRHLNTPDGISPQGSLVQGTDGNLYGLSRNGGTNHNGTIFKINASGTFSVLRHLLAATDGSSPEGSLVQGADGALYGTTGTGGVHAGGTIFKILPRGTFTVLRHLTSLADGSAPVGALVIGLNGYTYGTTSSGGSSYYAGTVFKLAPDGTYTVLKRFTPATDGSAPRGSLVQTRDGYLYGLANQGGTYKAGTLFRVSTSGDFQVIRHFNLKTDGGLPFGSLVVQQNSLVANAQSVTTLEETATAITLTGSGGFPLSYNIISPPKNGSLTGTGANRTYLPKTNFAGGDSFTYTVSVGCYTSAPAKVSISVNNVNDAPVLAAIGNKTITTGKALTFTATATEPDAGQTKTFSLVNAPAGASISSTSGAFTWTPATAGTYSLTVKVTDNASPALSDEELISITVNNATLPGTVRLNSGGSAVSTTLGSFSADAYVTGSTGVYSNVIAIEGTTSDALYQDYRRAAVAGGSFGYNIPLPNGTYTVKLFFAEISTITTTGKRVFNVSAENTAWLNNYDIVAAAGGARKAVTATKNVTVSDGFLTLNFTSVVDRACVAAIEVKPASTLTTSAALTFAEQVNDPGSGTLAGLYPNPVKDKLTVTLNIPSQQLTATITNVVGQIVFTDSYQQVDQNKLEIATGNWQPGVYVLRLQTNDGFKLFTFLKE